MKFTLILLTLISQPVFADTCDQLVRKNILDTFSVNQKATIEDFRILEDHDGYCKEENECLPDLKIFYVLAADKNGTIYRYIVTTSLSDSECKINSLQKVLL